MNLDQTARACYRDAQVHLPACTAAALHRRRMEACDAGAADNPGTRRFGWPLAAALGSACALVLVLGGPEPVPAPEPVATTALEALEVLDALDVWEDINLTALDEDSDFFLWLTTHEASLLAME